MAPKKGQKKGQNSKRGKRSKKQEKNPSPTTVDEKEKDFDKPQVSTPDDGNASRAVLVEGTRNAEIEFLTEPDEVFLARENQARAAYYNQLQEKEKSKDDDAPGKIEKSDFSEKIDDGDDDEDDLEIFFDASDQWQETSQSSTGTSLFHSPVKEKQDEEEIEIIKEKKTRKKKPTRKSKVLDETERIIRDLEEQIAEYEKRRNPPKKERKLSEDEKKRQDRIQRVKREAFFENAPGTCKIKRKRKLIIDEQTQLERRTQETAGERPHVDIPPILNFKLPKELFSSFGTKEMQRQHSRVWPHPRTLPEPDDPAGWGQFSEDTTTRLPSLRRSARIARKSGQERAAASTIEVGKKKKKALQVPEIPASVDDTTRCVSPERSGRKRPWSPEPSCSGTQTKIPRLEYYDPSDDSESSKSTSGCPSPVSSHKESRGPIWSAFFGKKEKLKKKREIKEPPKSDYNVPEFPNVDDITLWQREEAAVTGSQIPDIETEREPDPVPEPVAEPGSAEPDLGPEPVAEPDLGSNQSRLKRKRSDSDDVGPPKKKRKILEWPIIQPPSSSPSPSSLSSSSPSPSPSPPPTPPPVLDTRADGAGPMRRNKFATKRMLKLLQANRRVQIVEDTYNLRPERPPANFYKKYYYIRKYN